MKKKKLKKISRITITATLIFAMAISLILPLKNVFADNGYVLSFSVAGNHQMASDGGHLKIDGQFVDLRDSNEQTIGVVDCPSTTFCKITVEDGTPGYLNYYSANQFTLFMQGHEVSFDFAFNANEDILVQDYVAPQGGGEEPGPDGPMFDGRAVVVWSCGSGVCYHQFDNIPSFDNGNSKFYPVSEVTADNKPGTIFDVNAAYKGWYLTDTFNDWVAAYEMLNGAINWNTLDANLIVGDPIDMRPYEEAAINSGACTKPAQDAPGDVWSEFENCVDTYVFEEEGIIWTQKLQPLGEPNENNAYVSYGDRNFKVVIYNDNYKGITMGNLEDLHYYPAEWANPYLRIDQYDVSGTSKTNPALLNSILLESTVFIKSLDYNGFEISSIEALDVPQDAVAISKVGNDFKLVFSSNFYSNVTFKITDTNQEVSYVQIKRFTIDGWIKMENDLPVLTADFYFDRENSYEDFDLSAKIVYKDGKTKNVNLAPHFGIDDGLGNIAQDYEVDTENPVFGPKGKGLKKATFEYKLKANENKTIKKVYLNAEFKGSTASNYAGAYVGSGQGELANIYQEGGE